MRFVKHQNMNIEDKKPCGESSPYFNWLDQNSYRMKTIKHSRGLTNTDPIEPQLANPDELSEADAMYHVTEEQQEVKEKVGKLLQRAPQILTEKQYKVFDLVCLKGWTLRKASRSLGISHVTLLEHLQRAKKKLQRECERA